MLWATTEDGLQPTVVAHSARWIGAGTGDLTIEIPAALAEDIQAPFELRDLQLIDQGRMAVLHRQARALAVR